MAFQGLYAGMLTGMVHGLTGQEIWRSAGFLVKKKAARRLPFLLRQNQA